MLTISFICPFFFLSNQIFGYRFLGFYESQSLHLIHIERGQVYYGTKNQDAEIYFYHLLPFFFLFSISHSNVIHREICVEDFSGTSVPRILKFGTHVGYDLLYCVKENQHAAEYHSLYLSICPFFFVSNKTFCHRILSSCYSQSLQILYTPWEGPSILCERKPRGYD